MIVLLDTNVWAYAFAPEPSPLCETARRVMAQAAEGEFEACLSPQVLMELYAVLTRSRGGLETPLSAFKASAFVNDLRRSRKIRLIEPKSTTPKHALSLAADLNVAGPRVHDLFLAATALDNGVGRLCTADERFPQVPDLEMWNPFKK